MRVCPVCDTQFPEGRGRTAIKKYCSAKCLSKDAYQREIARRAKKCPVCDQTGVRADAVTCSRTCFAQYELMMKPKDLVLYVPRPTRPRKLKTVKPRTFVAGNCMDCGDSFVSVTSFPTKYCSIRCGRRAADRRRSAVKKMQFVENVYRHIVFARDGYICQLCKQEVDRSLHNQHPMALSIDHIVPLSKGGLHSMGNVQTAHHLCNAIKSDRLDFDLRLIRTA